MSIANNNGKGNLLISYIFNSKDFEEQVREELALKNEIANLLSRKGYKFIIADDNFIDDKLLSK